MFGKNVIAKIDHADATELAVESIFYTLQGEGPFSGRTAVFIRLAGCNLACTFCDTQFDTGLGKPKVRVDDIVNAVFALVPKTNKEARVLVVITGGEPLRQDISILVDELWRGGFDVQIETAGTCWPPQLDAVLSNAGPHTSVLWIVCSPKTPKIHPRVAELAQDYKYVVRRGELAGDGLPSCSTQKSNAWALLYRPPATHPTNRIWLSPCDDKAPAQNAANLHQAVHACLTHGYRLSLQTHKTAGLE